MNVIFIEPFRHQLLPFTYTKPVSELRCGILKMKDKWKKSCPEFSISHLTEDYLSKLWPMQAAADNLFINASVFPGQNLIAAVKKLKSGQALFSDADLLAYRSDKPDKFDTKIAYKDEVMMLKNVWDIFLNNHRAIAEDFELLTKNRSSQPIPETITAFNPENIFIEKGAKLYTGTLNASQGPIYIGKDTEIMESVNIRGPFALCDHSVVKMGAKIYTGTSIGPFSKVGGEVNNSVIQGYSNKSHEGYLGNSVVGQWCNIGAGSNTSNLKNNYTTVKLWSYTQKARRDTGLQFCGLMMGDFSKCGINTMFNTGTVVGVSANVFGAGFPQNFIPSFSWGGSQGLITYKFDKAIEAANMVMQRRQQSLTEAEFNILRQVFQDSISFR